jgi:hypothetical protein
MTKELSGITCLQPGQALYMAVDAGLGLRVLEGSVRVASSPAWISQTMFRVTATVHAGQVHVFERGGWVEIVAMSAARVQQVPRSAPAMSVIGRWAWRLAGR